MASKTVQGITIDNGEVTYRGKVIGRADWEYKHGYHPVVRLRMNKGHKVNGEYPLVREWETDQPYLKELFPEIRKQIKAGNIPD